jgi:hypothetical protein
MNKRCTPQSTVDRVLSFSSIRPNWDPSPFGFGGGGTHSLAGEEVHGGPNSDEGTDTVVLEVYIVCIL